MRAKNVGSVSVCQPSSRTPSSLRIGCQAAHAISASPQRPADVERAALLVCPGCRLVEVRAVDQREHREAHRDECPRGVESPSRQCERGDDEREQQQVGRADRRGSWRRRACSRLSIQITLSKTTAAPSAATASDAITPSRKRLPRKSCIRLRRSSARAT